MSPQKTFISENQFQELLLSGAPLIDLRAPTEFANGAFDQAVNIPLMSDDERAQVGTCYKQQGREAAVKLGHELVSGDIREERIAAWTKFVQQHPDAILYCWRGGMRSEIVQDWLADRGQYRPRVEGGYKALRNFCLQTISERAASQPWRVIAGRTGSAKTHLINRLENSIDLEGLAKHRGSAFGGMLEPQPTPVGFENQLAITMLRNLSERPICLEDEARNIGSLGIPPELYEAMQRAPIYLLEIDQPQRIENIYQDYIIDHPVGGERMLASIDRIRKRLGGDRHKSVRAVMEHAFGSNDEAAHRDWIEKLLSWYYDPMYDYQIQSKLPRVTLRGGHEEIYKAASNM